MTGEEPFREKALDIRAKLLDSHTTVVDDSYFLEYGFDFQIKTDYNRSAPWFSGMAQGVGLSAFLNWYEVTGDQSWLKHATRIYNSFLRFRSRSDDHWVTYRGDSGFLWLSEYPEPGTTLRVLNGFVIGLWGVYEYWLTTGDEEARQVVEALVTTIERHVSGWRNPGGVSYYDLSSGDPAPEHYHRLHVFQLRQLGKYFGESRFAVASNNYLRDRPDLDYVHCSDLLCESQQQ
jgi:hypothetical protein